MRRLDQFIAIAAIGLMCCLAGCDSQPPTSDAQANAASPALPADDHRALSLFPADFADWSRDFAAKKLFAGGKEQLAAAVRLAQLAECDPLIAPEGLTDATARLLRVKALDGDRFLLGVAVSGNDRALRSPVVVHNDGRVELIATGLDEELAIVYLSEDADIFPHLVVMPNRVDVLRDSAASAIVLAAADTDCRFRYQDNDGVPYIALWSPTPVDTANEIARFTWDPYELFFSGPASDYLDEAESLTFEIDIAASTLLIPQGGIIPKRKVEEPEPEKPDGPRIIDLNDSDTIPT